MWLKKEREMEPSLERIPFSSVEGREPNKPLTVFALSTCGFCRRALAYLEETGIAYRYVHVDKLDRSSQDIIRAYVKHTYRTMISYPFLCIGDDDYLTGFIRPSWEKEVGNA